jgi:hypothetical protein
VILCLEQDLRRHNGRWFNWKPCWFSGSWRNKRTWRFGWGMWSVSYYPEPGLRDFFDHVEDTAWQGAEDAQFKVSEEHDDNECDLDYDLDYDFDSQRELHHD